VAFVNRRLYPGRVIGRGGAPEHKFYANLSALVTGMTGSERRNQPARRTDGITQAMSQCRLPFCPRRRTTMDGRRCRGGLGEAPPGQVRR
jgi:hypothetical protein